MLLSPPILALLLSSIAVGALTLVAAVAGLTAVVGWDHGSHSRLQLLRERRWFLVEISLRLVLVLQLFSIVVFIATADHLKTLFTGAMCAVGSLNASELGPAALAAKAAAFTLCGLWLVVDRAASAAASNGLVRFKAGFLGFLAIVLIGENIIQFRYFADLDPDIITSCCAVVFGGGGESVGASLAGLPASWTLIAFYAVFTVTVAVGAFSIVRRRSVLPYSILAAILGVISAVAVIVWIAPSYYELPTHHCPLCLLASDHGFIGYPLYAALAVAVISGTGSGLVRLLRNLDLHQTIRANEELRLCAVSVAGFVVLAAIASWPLVASPFRLEGY